ncbi:histidine kinase [Paenibacillus sp. IB182496]|uniref:Histidine kinase n=1 Tax=Paenibacillus sabuli TaxID=2772509 RepID=A0A927GRC0_9BACL|nr:sensor histidine kinase [Paenibacillus sabuli]MBD2845313.1 histidine kinase [Paenibacillus sabuli]
MLLNSAIVIFAVSTIGFFSYYESSAAITRDVKRFSNEVLQQANLNLNRYYNEYDQFFLQLEFSKELQDWMELGPDQAYENYVHFSNLVNKFIKTFEFQHPEIKSISFSNRQGMEQHYRKDGLDKDYSLQKDPVILADFSPKNMAILVRRSEDYVEQDSIPVMTMIKEVFYTGSRSYIKMDVAVYPTQQIIHSINLGELGNAMIVDDHNRIIFHRDEATRFKALNAQLFQRIGAAANGAFLQRETSEIVVYQTVPYTNWKLVVVMPFAKVALSIEKVRIVTFAVALISLIISIVLVVLLSSSMTRRISRLTHVIKRTRAGDLNTRPEIGGVDEIAYLGVAYERMLGELGETIDDLAESKASQKRAISTAMQSQINSHFLYNTLETIRSLANLADQKEIEHTTVALSDLLRYGSQLKQAQSTIGEELANASNYLRIIQVRFGELISFEMSMEEQAATVPCLRLVVQPLVENCVVHGVEARGEAVHIRIIVKRPEAHRVSITIADDGPGFTDIQLIALRQQLAGHDPEQRYTEASRIGILNVHYRLQLQYGARHAGIRVGAGACGGAEVTVEFPDGSDAQ